MWTDFKRLLADTFKRWDEDNALRLAAALACYTILSLAPLLVVLVAVVGFFFGQDAVRGELAGTIGQAVGPDAADLIQQIIARTWQSQSGAFATVISVLASMVFATGIVAELKADLNIVFDVTPKPETLRHFITARFGDLLFILISGVVLMASVGASTAVSAVVTYLDNALPMPPIVLRLLDFGVSLAFVTLLVAITYRYLPAVRLKWRDVWVGSLVTALLFEIGKDVISMYLAKAAPYSAFGVAGTAVVLLSWIYYSSLIFFFGAEFTDAYADRLRMKAPIKRTGMPHAKLLRPQH